MKRRDADSQEFKALLERMSLAVSNQNGIELDACAEALRLHGTPEALAYAAFTDGGAHYARHQFDGGLASHREALVRFEELGDESMQARCLVNIGNNLRGDGDSDDVGQHFGHILPLVARTASG